MQEMNRLLINGGNRLKGTVLIDGAKNSALSIMAACLLSRKTSILENVPRLKDVYSMIEVIKKLGVKVEWENKNTLSIDPDDFNNYEAPYELVKTMRASFLVMGPLLARLRKAKISLPGGCAIGARPVDFHLKGFSALGADITTEKGYIRAEAKELKGNDIYIDFPSLGATENIMMAASLAKGTTMIENAAKDPEVIELGNFLNKMGAQINGLGSDIITIKGVEELKGVRYKIIPDRIEAGTYMVAAAITGGNVEIKNINAFYLKSCIVKLEEAGIQVDVKDESVIIADANNIKSVDIKTMPFPGFPTDMQAQFIGLLMLVI